MNDPTSAFLDWAEHDRLRSPHTLTRYRNVLGQVFPDYGDPLTITPDQLEKWWTSRLHLAPATRANELACLRSFYKWANRFDHRPDDPTRRLDYPRVDNQMPRMIGREDLGRLLGEYTDDLPDLRRAIALGVYAGLRVSEAAALEWASVDLETRRMYVRGKGRKERLVGVSPVLLDYILPECVGNVVTAGAAPYTAGALQRRVNRLLARHDIDHTFHDFRKRGASLALSHGVNPVAVKNMFGWSSMETVSAYAVVGDEELDQVAAAMV